MGKPKRSALIWFIIKFNQRNPHRIHKKQERTIFYTDDPSWKDVNSKDTQVSHLENFPITEISTHFVTMFNVIKLEAITVKMNYWMVCDPHTLCYYYYCK